MTLENYLLGHIIEEKSVIEELLQIDNTVQKTNYTYVTFLKKVRELPKLEIILDRPYNFVTDGDPDTVYNILISSPFVKSIHINKSFIALNKWLVERSKEYYQEKNMEVNLSLDMELEYNKYREESTGIILYGFPEFVEEMEEIFYDKDIAVIKK